MSQFGPELPIQDECYRAAVRPRGARGFWSTLADAVLRQCIRSPIGACVLRAIMDISAHAILLADRPRRAVGVTRVRRRREDRSSIVVSSSRRTRRVIVITSSMPPGFALFLCSCLTAVPSSRPAGSEVRRAQGPSRLAVARALPLARALPGHALAGPSTARGLSGWTLLHCRHQPRVMTKRL